MLSKLYVQYAMQNNRSQVLVRIVASNLANTSAIFASSMMMMLVKISFIVMTAAFVELAVARTSFTAKNVFLFDSTKQARILNCGHTMHVECFNEMFGQKQYRCPICSKSVFNMSGTWERLDQEIEATAMPEEYRYEVSILCNDCNNSSKASFHIFGHKCKHCNSYNTRIIKTSGSGSGGGAENQQT
ncbi:hypothetical protein RD792_003384 [Penstemon davidsonii]|uniref:RING-type domain-containing protein n=1 Tax=Penstemon davidsonii TaxID=160366 RepID=A0ABR0DU43_9LAMI|nr:hypothetical protein RD792_003384 [Penstemon davidsonii]